jgi:LRR-repeat protein 1
MRIICDVETHFEVLPSETTKGSFSKQPRCKATVLVGRKNIGPMSSKKDVHEVMAEDAVDDFNAKNTYLIVQTGKNPSGMRYRIFNNIKKIHAKFIGEGKGTVCFHNPPHMLALSKAEPSQLKSLLSLLRIVASPSGQASPGIGVTLSVTNLEPSNLMLKNGDIPKSRLRITSKDAYPLTGFPRLLEQLEATGISLTRIDVRICRLQNLTYLDLSNNHISCLPDFLKDCRLTELKLSGNGIEHIPPVVCSGPFGTTIKRIDLSRNSIHALPNNINLLQQLVHLKIDCNVLTTIPRNFGKLSNLKFFSASDNQIEVLPHSFAKLKLESVDLFGNPFSPPGLVERRGDLNLPPLKELSARTVKRAR